jgi:hypothetical protein
MGLIREKTRGEKSLLSPRIEIEDVTEICKPLRFFCDLSSVQSKNF